MDDNVSKRWGIVFYNDKVASQIAELPPSIQADVLRILELIRQHGPNLGRPHTAPLGRGLFEIRAKGREGIARSLFCQLVGQKIVILHTVIKKQMKLAKKDILLAKKRMREVKNHE